MICVRQLHHSPELLCTALAASSDVVVVVDDDCVIGYASPAAERVLGGRLRPLGDASLVDVVHPADRESLLAFLSAAALSLPGSDEPVRVRMTGDDGGLAELDVARVEPVSLPGLSGLMVVMRDVTALVEAERARDRARAQFEFWVLHDAVTGLPNRVQLEQRLEQLCGRDIGAARHTHLLMAKVADVDELRDRYGTRDADVIIRTLGRTIRGLAAPEDLVAAVGNGEYVVACQPARPVADVDDLARMLLSVADMPLTESNMRVDVHLVLGRTILSPERGVSGSLDKLAQAASHAIATRATAEVVFGQPSPDECAERMRLTADIERALVANEFELYYQPIRDVYSGRVAGFEGLLRWNHADRGVLCAADFLPAVEGTALIVDIGGFVLTAGCAQLARWQRRYGDRAPSLALNVSARQLRQGDFANRVRREIARVGADPTGLCLELTETHALEREPRALAELDAVREFGVSIALDDFGTGYSSLHHLQHISADVLKIDRSFIKTVGIDDGATAIVRAAIDLGGAFGMTTVAEGVTTIEQHRLLLRMGCDRMQGFLIAPALPVDLADELLQAQPAGAPWVGAIDADKDVDVRRARGRLALIDEEYLPSEDEVAALAGVTALDARRGLTLANRSAG